LRSLRLCGINKACFPQSRKGREENAEADPTFKK
jgi:hypothetical protein